MASGDREMVWEQPFSRAFCCYTPRMGNSRTEPATAADIPAIMAIERTPGFEGYVGRWSEDQHAAEMAKSSTRYLVLRDGGEVKAFAIFQQIGEPDLRVHLKRIVAGEAGQGQGSRLLGSALARSHRRPWIGELGFGEPVLRHPQRQRALLQHGCRIARLRD